MKRLQINSIKARIFINIVATVLVVVILIGGLSAYLLYRDTFDTLAGTMDDIAVASAEVITQKLEIYKNIAAEVGLIARLSDPLTTKQEKNDIYKQKIEMYNLVGIYTVDANGAALSNTSDKTNMVNDTDFFKASINGENYITDPQISTDTGDLVVIVSAPLWKGGVYGSTIEGIIVVVVDGKVLSEIASSFKVGEGGYGYILDKDGYTIGHPNYENVLNRENSILGYEKNGTDKEVALLEKRTLSGETVFGKYTYGGVKKILVSAPVKGSNGWGFFVNAPEAEYMKDTIFSIIVTAILAMLSLLVATILAIRLAKKISDPIIACSERLKLLSEGDLHTEVPKTDNKDETGELFESMGLLVDRLKVVIDDLTLHLGAVAASDFSQTFEKEFRGDFAPLAVSIRAILQSLNNIMGQMDESAEQVASGSEQVAGGAQALSQGSTEQASSIEELAATISEITEQINQSAVDAENAKNISEDASKEVQNGSVEIAKMINAMGEINETSVQIGKIIKSIEDIAFQTNILALNAAVEAARAGSAGKGFAVVADEVRNLASKSAEAAKNTTQLIENSLKAVENGSKIADKTGESLKFIVEKTNMTASLVEEIAKAAKQEAIGASQITIGIEQISSVVQTNSATAEESAAASEELSGQAQILKNMLSNIKLNHSSNSENI